MYSDSLSGFAALKSEEITHKTVNISTNLAAKDQLFQAINTIIGNLKQAFQNGLNGIKATRPITLKVCDMCFVRNLVDKQATNAL